MAGQVRGWGPCAYIRGEAEPIHSQPCIEVLIYVVIPVGMVGHVRRGWGICACMGRQSLFIPSPVSWYHYDVIPRRGGGTGSGVLPARRPGPSHSLRLGESVSWIVFEGVI